MAENLLYYGDNLDILRSHIKDETVDLIYLDPPFKSNRDYNVLFAEQNGNRSAAQIKAFEDTWEWNTIAAEAYQEIVETGGRVSQAMQAFRTILGESDMMAYLAMMATRLIELHRVLKPTGSIYLHCDPTASHYLKMLMDAAFGPNNFRNEIIWCYRGAGYPKNDFGKRHDVIFRYSKTDKYVFNLDDVREPYAETTKERFKHHIGNVRKGKDFGPQKLHPLGKQPDDWWQIQPIAPSAKERLGYPTQKPEALLERIIQASSNEGDVVLDPFCGCGTTIAVAQKFKRNWIGIDITHLAVALMKYRLKDMFDDRAKYEIVGEPVSLPDAKTLAKNDPYQFQWWSLGLVGARPVEQKKGADKGIDGRLYFHDEPDNYKAKTKQILFSVKAGRTGPTHVRDLRGVIEREEAAIGVFICMQKPTKSMRTEIASAGFYKSPWQEKPYPRLQIFTVEELLNGKKIECPPLGQVNMTFKKAPKAKSKKAKQQSLFQNHEE